MSSATSGDTAQGSEVGLQLAPAENEGPDFSLLKKGYESCIADLQSFCNQATDNYNTRYALWAGQSADGRKHAREGAKIDPTPWDGASDLQVFLTDEAIISKVAMRSMAFRRASISATPVEGNDIKRSMEVANYMRWLVQTQIPNIGREVKLLSNFICEMGIGAIGAFWEESQNKILANVSVEQLAQQFPNVDMQNMLYSDDASDDLYAIFEEQYGCTRAKAKKILASLRKDGKATVPMLGRKKSYPVVRAFDLNHNLFIPQNTTDLESASAIYRVEYFSAEELRSFVNVADWDSAWVEKAIETCRGQLITLQNNEYNQPISRSFMYQEQRFTDKIGVCYAYQKLSDEDGNSGIYQTIFNPLMPPDESHDGYAKFGLLGYAHGMYPFTVFRREYLSRKLHDTRGIPEPGKPLQQQIKVHKDSLIDAASMAILPPMMYPQGRPPLRWGAGARIPERRSGEYHYADRPAYDPSTEKSQAQLSADFDRYNGFVSPETDNSFAAYKNQDETEDFLESWGMVFEQIWSLSKQFQNETVFYRVVGLRQAEPIEFHKGEDDEEFDFKLTFDVGSLDAEKQQKKLEALARVAATFDKNGQIDYSQLLQIAVETIDINWAERIIQPADVGTQKVVNETHNMLAQVYSGVDRDIDLTAPPQLVQQTMQNYVQAPDVQKRYQEDPAFKARFDKLAKQTAFQLMQQQNAHIGRYGQ